MMSGITSLSPRDPGRSHCRMEGVGVGGKGQLELYAASTFFSGSTRRSVFTERQLEQRD